MVLDRLEQFCLAKARRLQRRSITRLDVQWNSESVDGHMANVDLDALREIFDALLSNAAAYGARDGRAAVRINARVVDGYLCLVFADEGPGSTSGERELVLVHGFRGVEARARVPHGVGEGLALANDWIVGMGGTLELLASERGATFEMRLPLRCVP